MAVRVCTLGLELFRLGGKVAPGQHEIVELNKRWQAITADAHAKVLIALRDYHGRFVQVHPDDREKLAELGLAFVDENSPLVIATKNTNPEATGGKSDATKTGGKSASKKE